MMTPNIWGQGQLFAFSAVDGDSFAGDDFVGSLSGDKLGIRFHTKVIRELAIVNIRGCVPSFETVAGDIITVNTDGGRMNIIYADTHLLVGSVVSPAVAVVLTEGIYTAVNIGDAEIQDTHDGEFTALLRKGDRFAFAYGHSAEEAAGLAQKGMELDPETLQESKLKVYENFSLGEHNAYSRLYAKCISVMKTQLYSPEGMFKRIWSTPDRLPHKNLWLWDSVFHSIGHRNLDTAIAEDLILAVLDGQREDGFIPHMAVPDGISDISQPPVLAWGSYLVYEKSKNKEFLKTVFEANKKFLTWCRDNRRKGSSELYTWLTANSEKCRCGECGMDNSPRFDLKTHLEAIDFCCFMANETRYMAKIAAELNDKESETYYTAWFEKIKADVDRKLWCEEDGFYYDYDIENHRLHKVWSVASFLPLFAGICDEEQAAKLVGYLQDPATFYTNFPIPSISKRDETYGTDMWRGPVWINYNYMIIEGLKEYGYTAFADEIRDKTIDVMNRWYLKKGVVFEFYDPEDTVAPCKLNRKGTPYEPYDFHVHVQAIRDFGWSNTLCLDMLHNKYCK